MCSVYQLAEDDVGRYNLCAAALYNALGLAVVHRQPPTMDSSHALLTRAVGSASASGRYAKRLRGTLGNQRHHARTALTTGWTGTSSASELTAQRSPSPAATPPYSLASSLDHIRPGLHHWPSQEANVSASLLCHSTRKPRYKSQRHAASAPTLRARGSSLQETADQRAGGHEGAAKEMEEDLSCLAELGCSTTLRALVGPEQTLHGPTRQAMYASRQVMYASRQASKSACTIDASNSAQASLRSSLAASNVACIQAQLDGDAAQTALYRARSTALQRAHMDVAVQRARMAVTNKPLRTRGGPAASASASSLSSHSQWRAAPALAAPTSLPTRAPMRRAKGPGMQGPLDAARICSPMAMQPHPFESAVAPPGSWISDRRSEPLLAAASFEVEHRRLRPSWQWTAEGPCRPDLWPHRSWKARDHAQDGTADGSTAPPQAAAASPPPTEPTAAIYTAATPTAAPPVASIVPPSDPPGPSPSTSLVTLVRGPQSSSVTPGVRAESGREDENTDLQAEVIAIKEQVQSLHQSFDDMREAFANGLTGFQADAYRTLHE